MCKPGLRRCSSAAALAARPGERGPQALLAHVPEVMLDAIDQGHRDLVPVVEHVLFRARDVALLPPDVQVGRDRDDDLPGRVAEVAAGTAEQGDHRWRAAA